MEILSVEKSFPNVVKVNIKERREIYYFKYSDTYLVTTAEGFILRVANEEQALNRERDKIIINLETDDPQNAVYPRITIQEKGTVITVDHAMSDQDTWVEGSVFKYGDTFYWVDAKGDKHTSTSNTSGFNTTSVSIRNTHTDDKGKVTVFDALVKKNTSDEKVVLDGANRVVSSSDTRIFGDDFSWNWTPLYEGKNELSFVGNCTVTVEYRYPIKCGEF
jgi:hypothetical protein